MNKAKLFCIVQIFCLLLMPVFNINAQNTGPAAPETMSFEPVDATDMVNLVTGDFAFSLPLLEVPGPEGGYPLSLSYNAGIGINQEASWVGLGWNVNPGGLTRKAFVYPDDIDSLDLNTFIYKDIGIQSEIGIGVWIPWVCLQLGFDWAELKTTEGSNRFWQASIGYSPTNDPDKLFGGGVSFGNNGIGIYGSAGPASISVGTGGISASLGMGPISINLSTEGVTVSAGIGASSANLNFKGQTNPSKIYTYTTKDQHIPLLLLDISHTEKNIKYQNITDEMDFGSMYSTHAVRSDVGYSNKQYGLFNMDVYEDPVNPPNYYGDNNNLISMAYDYYSVNAQGLNITISPRVNNNKMIFGRHEYIDYFTGDSTCDETYPNNIVRRESYYHNNSDWGNSFTPNDSIFYYSLGTNSGYSRQYDDVFQLIDGVHAYNDPGSNAINYDMSSNVFIGGESFYNEINNRVGQSSFTEYYTNKQIREESLLVRSKGFVETDGIERTNSELFPDQGIGAFTITTPDGKNYHYSLPVYQREQFTKKEEFVNDLVQFIFQPQNSPYAYEWLLTSITGPDYVDMNSNGKVDAGDLGYWVLFNYGKWTNSYLWSLPIDPEPDEPVMYGRKEIYYLDYIRTQTHTAYFIKSIREDGYGKNLYEHIPKDQYKFPISFNELFYRAANEFRIPGGYYPINDADLVYPNDNDPVTAEKTIDFQYQINEQKVLKLDKIILVSNNHAQISKDASSIQSVSAGGGHLDSYFYLKVGEVTHSYLTQQSYNLGQQSCYNNIIDGGDVPSDFLTNALKVVDFDYDRTNCGIDDYYLGNYSSTTNSDGAAGGKLTLSGVAFKGLNGHATMPPYKFEYDMDFVMADPADSWGYNSDNPAACSLDKIITPLGASINIDYESDSYYREAATDYGRYLKSIYLESENAIISSNQIWFNYSNIDNIDKLLTINNTYPISFTEYVSIEEIDDEYNTRSLTKKYDYSSMCTIVEIDEINSYIKVNLEDPINDPIDDLLPFDIDNISIAGNLLPKSGGGVRVSKITTTDEFGNQVSSEYTYDDPNTGETSGITSFTFDNDMFIPYKNSLPSPYVYYSYVTVKNVDGDNQTIDSTQYHFETLTPNTTTENNNFDIGVISFENSQNNEDLGTCYQSTTNPGEIYARSTRIHDNTASIGRLNSVKRFNEKGDLLNYTQYFYRTLSTLKNEDAIGINQETFHSLKRYTHWYECHSSADEKWFLNSTSRIQYPSIVDYVRTYDGNQETSTFYEDYDLVTGQPLTIRKTNPDGTEDKQTIEPAFKISQYQGNPTTGKGGMDSKLWSYNNKNMLTQNAQVTSFRKVNDEFVPIGVSIQTWNDDWYRRVYSSSEDCYTSVDETDHRFDIWRIENNCAWKGDLDENGALGEDFVAFNWDANSSTNENNGWKKVSEVFRYNDYSVPLSIKNADGKFGSVRIDNNNRILSEAYNSEYEENTFASGEDSPNQYGFIGSEVKLLDGNPSTYVSHTGNKSIELGNGKQTFKTRIWPYWQGKSKKYRISCWVYNNSVSDLVSINLDDHTGGERTTVFPTKKEVYGYWVKIEMDFSYDIPSGIPGCVDVWVTNNGSPETYVDDFSVRPILANVTNYVYDNATGQLLAILNNDNMAVKYYYDEAGILRAKKVETKDGFKTISKNSNHFARYQDMSDPVTDPYNPPNHDPSELEPIYPGVPPY